MHAARLRSASCLPCFLRRYCTPLSSQPATVSPMTASEHDHRDTEDEDVEMPELEDVPEEEEDDVSVRA